MFLKLKLSHLKWDESGQTTVEWATLSIMIALGLVVIGQAFTNGMVMVINTLMAKILDLVNAIQI
ncbi:Flp family type IVb pilin [candidate division CSSED10-310 bacterium]|uniref:Flp family type IVb pilin n=1 Tax=candidate division CSSED10-310 bacterium TaxID=2855610 RepID=A0ABV6Z6E2_UNCC1